jgi:hypothetical protein
MTKVHSLQQGVMKDLKTLKSAMDRKGGFATKKKVQIADGNGSDS